MKTEHAYQQLAYVYDAFMEDAPYTEFLDFTMAVFETYGNQVKKVVDLGCGTGQMAIELAKNGYDVQAVDYSEDMLAAAHHKAEVAKASVQFLHQDLRELAGLQELDAAVSYFDVMNYIVDPADLKTVFQRVATTLKSGGLFLFDVHSLNQLEEQYVGETFSVVTDDMSYIWFCEAGEEPGEVFHDLTFFVRNGSVYERFDEYHHQRTYAVDFYQKLLQDVGFKKIIWFAGASLNAENSDPDAPRIFFLAIK